MLAVGLQNANGAELCEQTFAVVWEAVRRGAVPEWAWREISPVLPGHPYADDSVAFRIARLARALVDAYERFRWSRSGFLRTLANPRLLGGVAAEVHSLLRPHGFIVAIAKDAAAGRLPVSEEQRQVIKGWSQLWR
ncbi:MAG: hypothetical protein EXR72_24270 [Myxococcales bacterium]|nr:hypothetical protein [Myxococcales bacterium]